MNLEDIEQEVEILNRAIENQQTMLATIQDEFIAIETRNAELKERYSNENMRMQVMEADKRVLIARKQNILEAEEQKGESDESSDEQVAKKKK